MLILLQLLLLIGICNLSPTCPPCAIPDLCIKCPTGCLQASACARSTCVKGKCETIGPTCSNCTTATTVKIKTTTPQKCKKDTDCKSLEHKICATCINGLHPPCTSVQCKQGLCHTIQPCSLPQTCSKHKNCTYSKRVCAPCPYNCGPGCTTFKCNDSKCELIPYCSICKQSTQQKCKCNSNCTKPTNKNKVCADCMSNQAPSCTQTLCENSKCVTIPPCSKQACSTDKPCIFNGPICLNNATCPKGYGPKCAKSECYNGFCNLIEPCSQHTQCQD
ncbi:unnamed protein product [Didymodactylos carnosus]|uniref:Uncharacterized protein n=1 Tax=Didymodactylos carnosus TaxID=1234261 RepID=A0A814SGY9_9BILA|nr:unnamed protein product [Didymodactylos carnosus]CAF3909900.1 unnamed protein product [Didymodactylos carnosus]